MGTRAGRKVRYGSLLIDAIDLAHVPRALELVIVHARAWAPNGPPVRPNPLLRRRRATEAALGRAAYFVYSPAHGQARLPHRAS